MLSSWYEDTPGIKLMRKITKEYKTGEDRLLRSRLYTTGWVNAWGLVKMKYISKNQKGEVVLEAISTVGVRYKSKPE